MGLTTTAVVIGIVGAMHLWLTVRSMVYAIQSEVDGIVPTYLRVGNRVFTTTAVGLLLLEAWPGLAHWATRAYHVITQTVIQLL